MNKEMNWDNFVPTREIREYDSLLRESIRQREQLKLELAELYHNRWRIELFFKWIKQHLKIKKFWGTSENAVRISLTDTTPLKDLFEKPNYNIVNELDGSTEPTLF